jgi:hypothetical protein
MNAFIPLSDYKLHMILYSFQEFIGWILICRLYDVLLSLRPNQDSVGLD